MFGLSVSASVFTQDRITGANDTNRQTVKDGWLVLEAWVRVNSEGSRGVTPT